MTDAVLTTREGDIVTWTLNRPEARNPISEPDVIEALENAVADVNGDPSVRVAIVTGAGSAFSSGGNVKHMRDRAGMFGGSPADLRQGYRHGIQRIPLALYHCEVPTIAAVKRTRDRRRMRPVADVRHADRLHGRRVRGELRQGRTRSRRRRRLVPAAGRRDGAGQRDGVHRRRDRRRESWSGDSSRRSPNPKNSSARHGRSPTGWRSIRRRCCG